MSETQHATRLGDAADWLDGVADLNADLMRLWTYGLLSKAVGGSGSPGEDVARVVGWALPNTSQQFRGAVREATDASWNFHWGYDAVKGPIDVLRLGDGVKSGTAWGYVMDGTRVVTLIPVARAGTGVVRRALGAWRAAAVIQSANVGNCSWIAAARLLRMTGHRPFASVQSLERATRAARIPVQDGMYVYELVESMRELGLRPTYWNVGSLDRLLALSRASPRGAVIFSVDMMHAQKPFTHTLLAKAGRFIDTSGRVFESVADFRMTYPGATMFLESGVYFLDDVAVLAPWARNVGLFGLMSSSVARDLSAREPWLRDVGLDNLLAVPLEPVGIEVRGTGETLRSLYPDKTIGPDGLIEDVPVPTGGFIEGPLG
jgi:hypothetical protein